MNKNVKVWKDTQKTFKSRWLSLESGLEYGGSGKDYALLLYLLHCMCFY